MPMYLEKVHITGLGLRRAVLLSVGVLVLGGCTLTQNKQQDVLANESYALLQGQQAMLSEHAKRLDILSESQYTLLERLGQLQTQLHNVSRQVSNVIVAQDTPVATEVADTVEAVPVSDADDTSVNGKAVLGRVEYALLESIGGYLKARIDTGAKSSSLNASDIQPFERNGDRWVRFNVIHGDGKTAIEAPLARYVRIRQASSDALERRPVVKLKLILGELAEETEFTLTDRTEMLYPILLGRSFLQDIAIVDVAKKFTRPRDPALSKEVKTQVSVK